VLTLKSLVRDELSALHLIAYSIGL